MSKIEIDTVTEWSYYVTSVAVEERLNYKGFEILKRLPTMAVIKRQPLIDWSHINPFDTISCQEVRQFQWFLHPLL